MSVSAPTRSYARELGEWVAALEFEDLSDKAIERIKVSVRDGIGCGVYGSSLPWSRIARDALLAQTSGPGTCTIWGTSHRLDPIHAALANGTATQSFESDDLHYHAHLHGSSVLLPAVLALAEQRGNITGKNFIAALAAGWEVGVRVSKCMGKGMVDRGWHPDTMYGIITAATGAGRALGLSSDQMVHCISLGVLQATGFCSVQSGGMAKRLYAGRAANIGVTCALLAEQGFTAPELVFEHRVGGFYTTIATEQWPCEPEQLSVDLGSTCAAEDIVFKMYSANGGQHPALDVLRDLIDHHPEIQPENLESLTVYYTEHMIKKTADFEPGVVITAQFNVLYAMAAILLEGNAFIDQYRDEMLVNPRLIALMGRMKIEHDPSLEAPGQAANRAARVVVGLRNGSTYEGAGITARGYPDRPIDEDAMREKFDILVRNVLKPAQAAALSDIAISLEEVDDVSVLARLTQVPD